MTNFFLGFIIGIAIMMYQFDISVDQLVSQTREDTLNLTTQVADKVESVPEFNN